VVGAAAGPRYQVYGGGPTVRPPRTAVVHSLKRWPNGLVPSAGCAFEWIRADGRRAPSGFVSGRRALMGFVPAVRRAPCAHTRHPLTAAHARSRSANQRCRPLSPRSTDAAIPRNTPKVIHRPPRRDPFLSGVAGSVVRGGQRPARYDGSVYGTVVVSRTKPSFSRIGRLVGSASVRRYRYPRATANRAR